MKSKLTPGLGSHWHQRYHDDDDDDDEYDGDDDDDVMIMMVMMMMMMMMKNKKTHTCLYRGQSCPELHHLLAQSRTTPVDSDSPRTLSTF